MNDRLTLSGAITDLGSITWKTDVVNYNINDSSYNLLKSTLNKLFTSPKGTIEKVNIENDKVITLTAIKKKEEKEEDVVLLAIREEKE